MTVTEPLQQVLQLNIAISLACLKPTMVRAFAGLSTSRRRELVLAESLASKLTDQLRARFTFSRDGVTVIKSGVISVLAETLREIPDDLARDWASKDIYKRDAAREDITTRLVGALLSRFAIGETNLPPMAVASRIWCGAGDDPGAD